MPWSLWEEYAALGPRILAFVSLVVIQVGVALVYKLSQRGGRYEFSQASALAMAELFKFLISAGLFVRGRDASWDALRERPLSFLGDCARSLYGSVSPQLFRNLSALSLSYAINNHLAFWVFLLASPGTIQLIKSGSTFMTAFILYGILSRPISQLQWIAMALQMMGLIQSQYSECAKATAAPLLGYGLLLVQVTLTAINGAYNDHVAKTSGLSLHSINVVLYLTGFGFNLVAYVLRSIWFASTETPEPGFFEGYTVMAILVVVANALMGIVITAVYKYADAIIKSVATTFSTAILLIVSAIVFSTPLSLTNGIGVCIVFIATYLYMRFPADAPAPDLGQKRETLSSTPHDIEAGATESEEQETAKLLVEGSMLKSSSG